MTPAPRRPRIVHVITRLIVGGAQTSVVSLCEGLNADFDVYVVSGPQTGPEGSLHRRAAETVPLTVVESLRREISPRWDPVAVHSLRRVLRRLDADIVHTHSSKAGIVGRLAAAPLRARVVHTVHGWGHTPADSRLRRTVFIALERLAARHCDALVAVSEDNRQEGIRHHIGLPNLYRVIPEVVELQPLDPDFSASRERARATLGIDQAGEVVGWVGRFVVQKDPETLSEALVSLLLARAEAQAVLIGDGPHRAQVEQVVRGAGIEDRVRFTGVVHDARALMPAFDVLLHPSRWEGQPIVIQEALAERVPVVAAKTSGTEELIEPGRTGYIVAPRMPDELTRAATAVLDTPALSAPLSEDSLDGVRKTHGRSLVLDRYRELYYSLLGELE
ncbi:MAG: glycosyltransferase family 4 protein [Actinobacteria bacterium]|nr:MAG: glycosyltransferase family 4 protein [Actinomycetota bacterium]